MKHKVVYLRRNSDEHEYAMNSRVEAVCDSYAASGYEVINVSFVSASVEAWIVLREKK